MRVRSTRFRLELHSVVLVCLCAFAPERLVAQETSELRGRLLHVATGQPVAEGTVRIEELGRETKSRGDGTYEFANVLPGRYHVLAWAPGFLPQRVEVEIGAAGATVEILLLPELHYTEVISVSADPRDPFEAYQPVAVLIGDDLTRHLQPTLGATLGTQPGMAERSLGPGPSRPVIRGLDGDRVLILEDGQRLGDLSSQSGDHGVPINPAAATRIEVVRGPATLLYGSSALGGIVNVISDAIPTRPTRSLSGAFIVEGATVAPEAASAADVVWGNGAWALRAGGGGRRAGDVATPAGEVPNTWLSGRFATIGISPTGARRYLGVRYGYDGSRYGVPFIEEGHIALNPRRHLLTLRAGGRDLGGVFESIRLTVSQRWYRHEELEDEEIGTRFSNTTTETELLAGHRRWGRVQGTVGGWALRRSFSAVGEETLSPPVQQTGAAAFAYEEVRWPHATVQLGGRVDYARYEPRKNRPLRQFVDLSGSVGLLVAPPRARDRVTVAVSIVRAARHPALEELYFHGEHPGNFAFEVGNAALESERALGVDLSIRWRYARASGELTYFRNSIRGYIFRSPTGSLEGDYPVIEFVAADSLLQGLEGHLDLRVAPRVLLELGLDALRGELREGRQPLPRIPPPRVRTGVRLDGGAFEAGADLLAVARQQRVFGAETPTSGYVLLNVFVSRSFAAGRAVSTLIVRLDNAMNRLYRNHLSLIKDAVPELGRNLKVLYRVRF